MIAGAMSRYRCWLTRITHGVMFCWFGILFAILGVVIVRDVVQDRNTWALVACGLGAGIWTTALVAGARSLRAQVRAFHYEDKVLWVQTFLSRRERVYPLSQIAGVELREGRGGYRFHKVVLHGGKSLILDPALANSIELAEQLRFDLNYAPFLPSSSTWPPLFAPVMLGAGTLTLILAGIGLFGALRWHLVGAEAMGTVTAFEVPLTADDAWVEITYEVDGTPHSIRPANWNAGHGKSAYSIGEQVPVLFLPDQPDIGIVNNFREQGEITLFLGFVGAFCLVCGFALWFGKARRRRMSPLLTDRAALSPSLFPSTRS
jgi:hypothetical protein